MASQKRFRSRISVLLTVSVLAIFILVSMPAFQHKTTLGMYLAGGLLLMVMLILTGIRYIISGNCIFVKIGFIRIGSIDILSISSVKRSYNPLSSPAASLKRLAVYQWGKSEFLSALISPVREQEFIDELKAINPEIEVNVLEKRDIWRIWDWDI